MSKVIDHLTNSLDYFKSSPDIYGGGMGGHYHVRTYQDSDGYYADVSYRDNNVARIALPPPSSAGPTVVLLRTLGYHTQSTSRTINAVLKVFKPELHVNIKRGKLTLSDGRLVPAVDWLEV